MAEKFERTKPHVNVGTIGHVDHGKTTLTAGILNVLNLAGNKVRMEKIDQIDRALQKKKREVLPSPCITANTKAPKRHYAHMRRSRTRRLHQEYDYRSRQMDGAILVVAATDGVMPQTREHILLAKQAGVPSVVVFK